ncbi:MAG: hypothetical protein ACI85O_002981 [Saprospiraceae bacterium]|jgi:hypothetical protein
MTYNFIAYSIYALISIFTIGYIGKILHRNGRYFVLKIMSDEEFGDFINNGLLVGYYLVNIGYVFFTLSNWKTIANLPDLIEAIGQQTGSLFILLGVLHFVNILASFKITKK